MPSTLDTPHIIFFIGNENEGRIAQLVEQLTLNQRVRGSNPRAPSNSHMLV